MGGTTNLALDLIGGVGGHRAGRQIAQLEAEGLAVSPDVTGPGGVGQLRSRVRGAGTQRTDTQVPAIDPTAAAADAGRGVAVALVDTGVANTPDLSGRLVRGPDFSGEGDGIDHFGHGTFMAGLIAGDGTASAAAGGPVHKGIAPGATVVSIKVAGADGTTSLSKVIAGIGWAVDPQR